MAARTEEPTRSLLTACGALPALQRLTQGMNASEAVVPASKADLPPSAVYINRDAPAAGRKPGAGASTLGGQPLCGPYPIAGAEGLV